MMVPLYVFALIYLIFLGIFGLLAFVNMEHIIATGSITPVSIFFSMVFWAIAIVVLLNTWLFLQGTDWGTLVTIWDKGWIQNLFSNNIQF